MIATADLDRLDTAVEAALAHGDESDLQVLGYGEINSVVAWHDASGTYACKRLPVFDDDARYSAYESLFAEYLDALSSAGVAVHDSRLQAIRRPDGTVIAYCVQPVIASEALAPAVLRDADAVRGDALLEQIVEHIGTTVSPTVGLDAQLSNWATSTQGLVYLDVTTPLLRDGGGRDRLDTELFVASLPAIARPVTRRFFVPQILDPYHAIRPAALDIASNLYKEGLAPWAPRFVEIANRGLAIDLDLGEVRGHHRREARFWSTLQRLRRVDRAWQRHVRRRAYPFLLPGPVDRRV